MFKTQNAISISDRSMFWEHHVWREVVGRSSKGVPAQFRVKKITKTTRFPHALYLELFAFEHERIDPRNWSKCISTQQSRGRQVRYRTRIAHQDHRLLIESIARTFRPVSD